MFKIQWIALGLFAFMLLAQAEVLVQYTACPKDCKCEKDLMNSKMKCTSLFSKNYVNEIPVTHFELTNSGDIPLKLTEDMFKKMGLEHANVISISNSNIESIDQNTFRGLQELTHIELINCKITKLHPETFDGIPNLNKLKLSGNPLNKDVVIVSKNLEQLVISDCALSDISEQLFENISAVTFLDLSNNNIEKLSTGVFDTLMDLQEINLSHNKLKEVSKDLFAKNDILNFLNLSYNPLTTFSGEEFKDLETLDLKSCLIEQIDGSMFKNMDRLGNLDLSYNKIKSIDVKSFENMTVLTVIDLSGNELQLLDRNMFVNNVNLQKIRLDNNMKLAKLPSFNATGYHFAVHYFSCRNCNLRVLSKDTFKNMPSLVTLFLPHNNIIDISNGVFQNLTSLIELNLSYNEITTVDDDTFINNVNLQRLSLSFNPMKALHASMFKENSNLKVVDLSNCGLYMLWTAKTSNIKIPSILSLNISNNNIKIITREDVAVTNRLKTLDISKNPLDCNEDLKSLVEYLYDQNIRNNQYLTHDKQSYDFEDRDKDILSWREIVTASCPNLLDDEDDDDLDEDDFDDTDEDLNYDSPTEIEVKIYTETSDDNEEVLLPLKHNRYSYSYMWPILIFLGTALAVLGLVVNVILFVLRRRQTLPVARIIQVPKMSSRLKTNSGLVYQQLSEEHGSKTPILGRFTPIASVHGYPNENEHV